MGVPSSADERLGGCSLPVRTCVVQMALTAIVTVVSRERPERQVIRLSCLVSGVAYWAVVWLVPLFAQTLREKGLAGRDLGKLDWRVREALFGSSAPTRKRKSKSKETETPETAETADVKPKLMGDVKRTGSSSIVQSLRPRQKKTKSEFDKTVQMGRRDKENINIGERRDEEDDGVVRGTAAEISKETETGSQECVPSMISKETAMLIWQEKPEVPESLGIVVGFVFLMASFVCLLGFRHEPDAMLDFVAGILAICFVTFLGFTDDVLDLRWRYKLVIPLFASLPLLAIYRGPTYILVPNVLKPIVSNLLNLPTDPEMGTLVWEMGRLYSVYISSLTIFCTNSINIYAGLNGLEVGQSIIICLGIVAHNLIELSPLVGSVSEEIALRDSRHVYSLVIATIFASSSLALYHYNRYPSAVFIGDTYTYFAGVFFAVAGILGHFSKTLLLFFLPQIVNFLYSFPQLIGIVSCPRHRLPYFEESSGKLISNGSFTVLNLVLRICGPMKEQHLVRTLLGLQVCCCVLALGIRYSPIWKVAFL